MKKFSAILLSSVLFCGCVLWGPMKKSMDRFKLPQVSTVSQLLSGNFVVDVEKTASIVGLPEKMTVKKKNYIVPLPFVAFFGKNMLWQPGDSSLLSPMYYNLETSLKNEAATGLSSDIKGKYTLKVKVDSSNCSFRYRCKGFIIWLFIVQFGKKKEYCSPQDMALTVSYELLKDGQSIKTGVVTKSKHIEDKITSGTQPSFADPYYPLDQNSAASTIRGQDNFALGGVLNTISNGMIATYANYNILISEVAKQVIAETKESVQ